MSQLGFVNICLPLHLMQSALSRPVYPHTKGKEPLLYPQPIIWLLPLFTELHVSSLKRGVQLARQHTEACCHELSG